MGEITITLLYSNKIEGKALSLLLKNKGYEVEQGQIKKVISTSDKGTDLLLVIDTRFLFQVKKTEIKHLCNSNSHTILLGSLNHFHWFFKFNFQSKSFISKREEIKLLYSGIDNFNNPQPFLSDFVTNFLEKEYPKQQKYLLKNLNQRLTDTELRIMLEIAKGKTTQQIAEDWHRSKHTIYNHRKNIMKKLNLEGTFRLPKFCFQNKSSIQTLFLLNKNKDSVDSLIKN